MEDWRLVNSPNYIKGRKFIKVKFPEFWVEAFKNKNAFYDLIKTDAVSFVEKHNRGEEFLSGEKIQDFWHSHCIFCTEKITTRENKECYSTKDFSNWICKSCFNDFKDKFNLSVDK